MTGAGGASTKGGKGCHTSELGREVVLRRNQGAKRRRVRHFGPHANMVALEAAKSRSLEYGNARDTFHHLEAQYRDGGKVA